MELKPEVILWTDPKTGLVWLVEVQLVLRGVELVCVGLQVRSYRSEGVEEPDFAASREGDVQDIPAVENAREGVTSAMVRDRLPVGALIAQAKDRWLARVEPVLRLADRVERKRQLGLSPDRTPGELEHEQAAVEFARRLRVDREEARRAWERERERSDLSWKGESPSAPKGGRPRIPLETLEQVADIYTMAQSAPTQTVAVKLRLPYSRAAEYVRRARKVGLIKPARGRGDRRAPEDEEGEEP